MTTPINNKKLIHRQSESWSWFSRYMWYHCPQLITLHYAITSKMCLHWSHWFKFILNNALYSIYQCFYIDMYLTLSDLRKTLNGSPLRKKTKKQQKNLCFSAFGCSQCSRKQTLRVNWIPFYQHGNQIYSKICDDIIYPFSNSNGCTVKIWEWISNFMSPFIMYVIT